MTAANPSRHPFPPSLRAVTEFGERLAYYGIATNIITYLTGGCAGW